MKKIVTTLSVGFSMALLTMPVLADPQKEGKQWNSEKTTRMEIN